jgi:hypothetical protein
MKSALIRSGAAAIVATFAFAACGGSNGMVPSASGPVSSSALRTVAPAAANPCPIPVGFPFGGSCNVVALTTAGGSGKLAPYKGFSLTSTLGSNNAKKGTALVFQDATGKGDIGKDGTTKFPLLKGAFLYLAALNTGKPFGFNVTPGIVIKSTKTKITGTSCALNELTAKGWIQPGITGTIKGNTISFLSLPASDPVPAGAFYLAFTCSK